MRSTSVVQVLEGVFQWERRFCSSSDRLRTRESLLLLLLLLLILILPRSAFCFLMLFDEFRALSFANSCLFSLLFSSLLIFIFFLNKFSINFRSNRMNVWNLSCLEKRALYDSLTFARIWNLINKWKLLRWSKMRSSYIKKANKEILNVSNELRPGMFLELRAK